MTAHWAGLGRRFARLYARETTHGARSADHGGRRQPDGGSRPQACRAGAEGAATDPRLRPRLSDRPEGPSCLRGPGGMDRHAYRQRRAVADCLSWVRETAQYIEVVGSHIGMAINLSPSTTLSGGRRGLVTGRPRAWYPRPLSWSDRPRPPRDRPMTATLRRGDRPSDCCRPTRRGDEPRFVGYVAAAAAFRGLAAAALRGLAAAALRGLAVVALREVVLAVTPVASARSVNDVSRRSA